MGAIGGLLGTAGGASGTGFSPPSKAPLQAPVTKDEVTAGNAGVTSSLGGAQGLLNALQGQNPIGEQADTLNQGKSFMSGLMQNNGIGLQTDAYGKQQGLNQGLAGLNGLGAQAGAMGQQGALGQQLGNAGGVGAQQAAIAGLGNVLGQQQGTTNYFNSIANGTGPNPAQAALNQATAQNIQNQAALMAGQRGAGANIGLMARQAAMNGAGIQQQAVGQAATLQAEQQIAALSGLAAQQQAMGNTAQAIGGLGAGLTTQQQAAIQGLYGQGAGAVNQQQTGIGQQFGQGNTIIGQQQGQLAQNAGIAQNMVGNTLVANNQLIQGNIANSGQLINGLGGLNTNNVNMQGNINTNNASLATAQMGGQKDMIGGLMNGLGAAGSLFGGKKPDPGTTKDTGGNGGNGDNGLQPVNGDGSSSYDRSGESATTTQVAGGGTGHDTEADTGGANTDTQNTPDYTGYAARGGMIRMADGGEIPEHHSFGNFLTKITAVPIQQPQDTANQGYATVPRTGGEKSDLYKAASSMAQKGATKAMAANGGDFRMGGSVQAGPGQKAVAAGNSYANDKIPAMLSEGEVVIPRSVMMSKDPVKSSADFVAKVLAKRGKK